MLSFRSSYPPHFRGKDVIARQLVRQDMATSTPSVAIAAELKPKVRQLVSEFYHHVCDAVAQVVANTKLSCRKGPSRHRSSKSLCCVCMKLRCALCPLLAGVKVCMHFVAQPKYSCACRPSSLATSSSRAGSCRRFTSTCASSCPIRTSCAGYEIPLQLPREDTPTWHLHTVLFHPHLMKESCISPFSSHGMGRWPVPSLFPSFQAGVWNKGK